MQATIFNIQRFSVHDGPGIRTTVFIKGCPLRCRWCHNPEGLRAEPELQLFEDECIGCCRCGGRTSLSDARSCPTGALRVCGREYTVDEVLSEIARDEPFYGDDGGVTFSGGECLTRADFVAAVLKGAREMGIHTAIDTSGYARWSELEKTLDVCELYLYDVKCADPALHKEYTGVDNGIILDNLRRLSSLGKRIWVRVPVIPDFNCSEREMNAIADIVASLRSVEQVTLMPYHTLGQSKYKTLGLKYTYEPSRKIGADELETYKRIFTGRGITLCKE